MHDLFDVLGVSSDAAAADLQEAPRRSPDREDSTVDFARVEPLVGRMRAAFFGVARHRPAIDVPVTPWQVRSGAPVSVGVPARHLCLACGGRGEQADERCAPCRGTGLVRATHHLQLRVPPAAVCGQALVDVRVPGLPTARLRLRLVLAARRPSGPGQLPLLP